VHHLATFLVAFLREAAAENAFRRFADLNNKTQRFVRTHSSVNFNEATIMFLETITVLGKGVTVNPEYVMIDDC